MRAVVLSAFGTTPQPVTFADPEPREGEALVRVTAASLKNADRLLATGTAHALRAPALPAVCGVDGVGTLPDGQRVYFMLPRAPYGAMAEYAPVPRERCLPVPDGVDDAAAAALPNPALSAWSALVWRAELKPGETVLVLGATGATGGAAVQLARSLGAGRVVAAGRNPEALARLPELGADAVVRLDGPEDEVVAALADAAGDSGYDVVCDYVWGRPTELFFAAVERRGYEVGGFRIRHVAVGHLAGPTVALPANLLTNSGLEILGNGTGTGAAEHHAEIPALLADLWGRAARGELRIDVEPVPLADAASAWVRPASGPRLVLVP